MKKFAKNIVAAILGWQVRRLRRKNDIKVVAVAGSIGKTSTKFAIAHVLQQQYKVRFQEGNYNDLVSVPLIFFGHTTPSLFNPFAWLRIFLANEAQLKNPYPYEVVVVEVGTDGPGQLARFGGYLQADIGVITAISPEHMEFFSNLDAVAKEELAVAAYSNQLLINADLCAQKYIDRVQVPLTLYGTTAPEYQLRDYSFSRDEAQYTIAHNKTVWLSLQSDAVSLSELYSASAAALVAHKLEVPDKQIAEALATLKPVSGRMQRLKGIKDSLILDETYNASPVAVKSALDSLYMIEAPQKIALLGNMNELGTFSEAAHREIGEYCEPKQLDLVVTLGPDANTFLAISAQKKGCEVVPCESPYEAAAVIRERLKSGAVILAKGSQNRVFAEEAVKLLLANKADVKKLVRQDQTWLKKKQQAFKRAKVPEAV